MQYLRMFSISKILFRKKEELFGLVIDEIETYPIA